MAKATTHISRERKTRKTISRIGQNDHHADRSGRKDPKIGMAQSKTYTRCEKACYSRRQTVKTSIPEYEDRHNLQPIRRPKSPEACQTVGAGRRSSSNRR
jgi:hypothetical protein